MLRGTVHDPTSRRMGGVSGHAGLFGTAGDLGRFAAMVLSGGTLGDTRILSPLSVARMTTPATPVGIADRRGLGWDIDSRYSANRGDLFPIGSFGHTGFTGTSVWLDPSTQTAVIFLSSRLHPDGQGDVTALRGQVATLVAAAVTGEPGSWSGGGAVLRRRVRDRLGSSFVEGLVVADGSGLSRGNRVTAALVTAWLAEMHEDETLSDVFLQSLAVAGTSGTLEKRFAGIDLHGATVRAKTGYINAVSCLSGYVATPDGRTLCFSVLVNGLVEPGSVRTAKRLQERIVGAVAEELTVVPASLGSD